MKQSWDKISYFIKKIIVPYIPAAIIVGFVVWHLFFAQNDYFDICQNDRKIRELEQEIAHEEARIKQLQDEIYSSESDAVTIDRIARERHGMQRVHEDVYIVKQNTPDSIAPQEATPETPNNRL